MKPIRLLIILLSVVIVISVAAVVHWRHRPARVPPMKVVALPLPLAGVTVILDPGHGGADSGARCAGITEASLTYRTAVETANDLEAEGATVIYTVVSRTLDSHLTDNEPNLQTPRDALLRSTGQPLRSRRGPALLWQRTRPARICWLNRNHADPHVGHTLFFLSLHYDDFHLRRVHGGLVCVDRRNKCVSALGRILSASLVAHHLARNSWWHGLPGISGQRLGVLDPRYNPLPESVLLEIATLSNATDRVHAMDASWRVDVAHLIVDAIRRVHEKDN